MLSLIIYCKDHKRRPIRFGATPLFRDAQASIPYGWCIRCGGEVFEEGQIRCVRCRKTKGEK